MLHQIWLSAEKNPRSAELKHTFCEVEFRRKKIFSAEILGQNIESAEVHYTKPEDGFRPNIGLNTKFRREFFFSRSQVHNLCSGVPPKDQFRPKSAQWIPGHRISIFRRKKIFSADLMPHNPPQRKNRSAESAFFLI